MSQARMFPQSKVEKILEEAADALTTAMNKKSAADKAVKAATSILLERMKKCRRRQMRVGNQIISIEQSEKVKVVEIDDDDDKKKEDEEKPAPEKKKTREETRQEARDAKAKAKAEESKTDAPPADVPV